MNPYANYNYMQSRCSICARVRGSGGILAADQPDSSSGLAWEEMRMATIASSNAHDRSDDVCSMIR